MDKNSMVDRQKAFWPLVNPDINDFAEPCVALAPSHLLSNPPRVEGFV